MRKLLIIVLIFFLIGCSGKYDGLIVEDGDENIYKLDHSFGDVYFVTPLNKDNQPFAETNKRLLERNKAK